jgi:hypothetical protein
VAPAALPSYLHNLYIGLYLLHKQLKRLEVLLQWADGAAIVRYEPLQARKLGFVRDHLRSRGVDL